MDSYITMSAKGVFGLLAGLGGLALGSYILIKKYRENADNNDQATNSNLGPPGVKGNPGPGSPKPKPVGIMPPVAVMVNRPAKKTPNKIPSFIKRSGIIGTGLGRASHVWG